MDVLAFGAHPDDIEMGMGGTIARLSEAGQRNLLVSLTPGERGTHGDAASRAREAAAAAAILGSQHRILDFPDTQLEYSLAGRLRLMRLVREVQPRIVFAPYHTSRGSHHDGAAHVDHLTTGALVRDAVKLARLRGLEPELPAHDVQRLFFYMVPRHRTADFLVDVSGQMDVLRRALDAYATQMRIQRQGNDIREILEAYRRYYGIAAGCLFAEAFLCDEPLRVEPETLFRI